MSYKEKIYIAFDIDNDFHCYDTMQTWEQDDGSPFEFVNAYSYRNLKSWNNEDLTKEAFRERMHFVKVFMLLVGEQTRFQHNHLRWECEQALVQKLPIIVVNLDGTRFVDEVRCPFIFRDKLALHISYKAEVVQYALENWPEADAALRAQDTKAPRYYQDFIYKQLGLNIKCAVK